MYVCGSQYRQRLSIQNMNWVFAYSRDRMFTARESFNTVQVSFGPQLSVRRFSAVNLIPPVLSIHLH